MKKLALQTVIVVVSVVVLAEVFLRLTGKYPVYSEINGGDYYTEYGTVKPSWYHIRPANDTSVPASPDFHYQLIINSLGFRDKEYSKTKGDSTIRILVTGDSFAEGVGAPYDSTWPRLMEKYLREKGIRAEVINAGVAGSDIMYAYVFYRDKLKDFNPDIVIAAINSTDYIDCIMRGGMERFNADGKVHFKQPPWFEPLYKHSRFFRAVLRTFFNYWVNGLYVSANDYKQLSPQITEEFAKAFEDYKAEAEKNNARFIGMLHNMPGEIITPENIIFKSNDNLNLLDKKLSERGIEHFNISGELYKRFKSEKPESYSYLRDYHYNPTGYAYMAHVITDSLITKQIFKP